MRGSKKEISEEEREALKEQAKGRKVVWSNNLIGGTIPSPTPMSWEVAKTLFSGAVADVYVKDFGLGRVPSDYLTLICGRPYFNMNQFFRPFAFYGLPIKAYNWEEVKKDPSKANDFSIKLDTSRRGFFKASLFIFKAAFLFPHFVYRILTLNHELKEHMENFHIEYKEEILPDYLEYIEELESIDLEKLTGKELVAKIHELIHHWGTETVKWHVYSEVSDIVYPFLEWTAGDSTETLLSGLEGDKHLETNIEMWKLSQEASPEVKSVLLESNLDEISDKLKETSEGRNFLARMEEFLEEYGHRAADEFELAVPRWKEDPRFVFETIRNYLKAGDEINPVKHFEEQKSKRKQEEKRILEQYSEGWFDKLLPAKRKTFEDVLKFAQIYLLCREDTFQNLPFWWVVNRFLLSPTPPKKRLR